MYELVLREKGILALSFHFCAFFFDISACDRIESKEIDSLVLEKDLTT